MQQGLEQESDLRDIQKCEALRGTKSRVRPQPSLCQNKEKQPTAEMLKHQKNNRRNTTATVLGGAAGHLLVSFSELGVEKLRLCASNFAFLV